MTNDRDNDEKKKGNSREDTVEKESKKGLKRHRTKWETEKKNFENIKRNCKKSFKMGKQNRHKIRKV